MGQLSKWGLQGSDLAILAQLPSTFAPKDNIWIHNRYAWAQRLAAEGVLQLGPGEIRVKATRLVAEAKALMTEFGPAWKGWGWDCSPWAILRSLPHTTGQPLLHEVAAMHEAHSNKVRRALVKARVIVESPKSTELHPDVQYLHPILSAFQDHRATFPLPFKDCIHARGMEAAWLTTEDEANTWNLQWKDGFAFKGARRVDEVDVLAFRARASAKAGPRGLVAPSEEWAQLIARRIRLQALVPKHVGARFDYYGCRALWEEAVTLAMRGSFSPDFDALQEVATCQTTSTARLRDQNEQSFARQMTRLQDNLKAAGTSGPSQDAQSKLQRGNAIAFAIKAEKVVPVDLGWQPKLHTARQLVKCAMLRMHLRMDYRPFQVFLTRELEVQAALGITAAPRPVNLYNATRRFGAQRVNDLVRLARTMPILTVSGNAGPVVQGSSESRKA